jgi:cell division protein ZapA
MAIVTVKIGGREYHLACDDGQEEHLRLLADDVDDRVRDLNMRMGGNAGEVMGFLLAAITMADELLENKKEIEKLTAEKARIASLVGHNNEHGSEYYHSEAVAVTLEEIAERIERIAERVEMR